MDEIVSARIDRLQAVDDPLERMVRAAQYLVRRRSVDDDVALSVLGSRPTGWTPYSVESDFLVKSCDVDARAVAQWFADRAFAAGLQASDVGAQVVVEFGRFGKLKRYSRSLGPGWRVPGGSTKRVRVEAYDDRYKHCDAFISLDGQLWLGDDEIDYQRRSVTPAWQVYTLTNTGLAHLGDVMGYQSD